MASFFWLYYYYSSNSFKNMKKLNILDLIRYRNRNMFVVINSLFLWNFAKLNTNFWQNMQAAFITKRNFSSFSTICRNTIYTLALISHISFGQWLKNGEIRKLARTNLLQNKKVKLFGIWTFSCELFTTNLFLLW